MNLKSLIPYYKEDYCKDDYSYTFTVFTPVYNRAETIHRVFESLNNQTFKDFEFIIINDGSTDNSHERILELTQNANFKFRYINNKNNQHKMACLSEGIKLANGKFFLPFDSDDTCTIEALETFAKRYEEIPNQKKSNISGVTCLCEDQYGKLVGKPFPESPYYSSTIKNLLDGKYNEEKWGFTKTSLLKNVVIQSGLFSKGYIPEGTIWTLFSYLGFETCYINDTLRTYYVDDTDNSITSDSIKNRAFGLTIYSLCILNRFFNRYFLRNPILFLKQIYYLLKTSKYLNYNLNSYVKAVNNYIVKLILTLFWPFRFLI